MDLIIENQKKINHRLDMLEQTGKVIDTPKPDPLSTMLNTK